MAKYYTRFKRQLGIVHEEEIQISKENRAERKKSNSAHFSRDYEKNMIYDHHTPLPIF